MTYNEFKKLVVAEAERLGITEYELYYQSAESLSARVFRGEGDSFTASREGGVCFRCIAGGKMGYASTEELSEVQAAFIVKRAFENAQVVESEEPVFLAPGGQRYQKMAAGMARMVSADDLIALALDTQKNLYQYGGQDGSMTQAVAEESTIAIVNSKGLDVSWGAALNALMAEAVVEENGMTYAIPLSGGQKTGWFYDQRVNRAALTPFVQAKPGCSVLDAFCYAGSFGALAAKNGAGSVAFMDASAHALEFARRNAASVGCDAETLQGDALGLLADLRREGRQFDIVCLDPPAFIKRKKDAKQGLEAYARVNELGLDLVKPGGMLMTCSCSHHLEADALRNMVTRAAGKRRRFARLLFQGFQGPDHPIHPAMPETAYLKTFLFHIPE